MIYWSQRFQDGRTFGGEIRWRVPVRCGSCGQMREISSKWARAQVFTGLCDACARLEIAGNAPILKTCTQCGQTFHVRPSRSGRKFCSRQCMAASFRTGKIVMCANCEKEIYRPINQLERPKSGLYFCSPQCLNEYAATTQGHQALKPDARQRYDEMLQGENVECAFCGKSVYKPNSQLEKSKSGLFFCSPQCVGKHRDTRQARECAQCGKVIYRADWQIKGREKLYCSVKCRSASVKEYWRTIPRKERQPVNKKYLLEETPFCELCSLNEPDILEIHHKDRNPQNNAAGNLMVVCPNCHTHIHLKDKRRKWER